MNILRSQNKKWWFCMILVDCVALNKSIILLSDPQPVAYPRGCEVLGFNPPPPPRKKSSPYLGVSLWFGDTCILSEKQCPICLRLHEKTFGNQKISRGSAPRPLYSKIFFYQILNPHLIEKLYPPLTAWMIQLGLAGACTGWRVRGVLTPPTHLNPFHAQ